MATATQIINKATKYIGVKESPRNSNNVIFNTHYYGKPVKGSAYPWCCAFVWDIFRMCKASKLFFDGQKTAYCPAVLTWGRKNKLTVAKNRGKKGDLVLFDWNLDGVADHIGFIYEKNKDGTYKTIEGNTSVGNDSNGGEVMYRTRSSKDIIALIRPKYALETQKDNNRTTVTKTTNTTIKTKKSVKTIAKEVIDGKWGFGDTRSNKLKAAGYNPEAVQKEVNKMLAAKDMYKVSAKKGLRLRKGAGIRYKRILTMKYGEVVKKIGEKGKWYEVKYKDKTGYCSKKYLTK